MKKKISSVQLHDVMFVPGIGEVKKTLNVNNLTGLKIEYSKCGQLLEVSHETATFDIPVVNCKNIAYSWVDDAKAN